MFKHGESTSGGTKEASRLYTCWQGMKRRCYNTHDEHYPSYGARGITVCDEWRNNYLAFKAWATANGYADSLTLNRIDNDGAYSPDNCRWATPKEQSANLRNNHNLTVDGETCNLSEWSRRYGVERHTIRKRLQKGWTVADAVKTPTNPKYNGHAGVSAKWL